MSYTTDVATELMELEAGKTCCRKAFLLGLFFGADTEQNNRIKAEFRSEEIAKAASEILKRQFSAEPEIVKVGRAEDISGELRLPRRHCFLSCRLLTKKVERRRYPLLWAFDAQPVRIAF